MNKKNQVFQYDSDGNYLEDFESVTLANKSVGGNENNRPLLSRAIRKQFKHLGFYWSYSKRDNYFHYNNNLETNAPQLPAVLIFDIETSFIKCYTFETRDTYIAHDNIIEDWYILGYSAKWLYDTEILSDFVTPEEAVKCNDKRVCESLWNLLDKATIVITHNGDHFDIKKCKSRWLFYDMIPPSPVQSIDTLKISRSTFGETSNKLDALGAKFLGKKKHETNKKLWRECMAGKKESLDYMEKYCRQDTLILEDYYLKIRPWIKSHPSLGLHVDTEGVMRCNVCLGDKFAGAGYYTTNASKFKVHRCLNCGCLGRLRKSEVTKEQKEQSLISVAR